MTASAGCYNESQLHPRANDPSSSPPVPESDSRSQTRAPSPAPHTSSARPAYRERDPKPSSARPSPSYSQMVSVSPTHPALRAPPVSSNAASTLHCDHRSQSPALDAVTSARNERGHLPTPHKTHPPRAGSSSDRAPDHASPASRACLS